MFKLKVKDGDTTKETTLAEIVANVDGLSSTVAANKEALFAESRTCKQVASLGESVAHLQRDLCSGLRDLRVHLRYLSVGLRLPLCK